MSAPEPMSEESLGKIRSWHRGGMGTSWQQVHDLLAEIDRLRSDLEAAQRINEAWTAAVSDAEGWWEADYLTGNVAPAFKRGVDRACAVVRRRFAAALAEDTRPSPEVD